LIKIDWDELQSFYNRVFGTKFVSRKAFLRSGYKKFGSIKEFALKLGISSETLRKQLKKDNIKINLPIRPRLIIEKEKSKC
jgi:predicted enzyme related to lactoylglutathione lyase